MPVEDDTEQCELCGHDHESRHCDQSFCSNCRENVENCDCDSPNEIDAEEFLESSIRNR